jgi:hypothetical protein
MSWHGHEVVKLFVVVVVIGHGYGDISTHTQTPLDTNNLADNILYTILILLIT